MLYSRRSFVAVMGSAAMGVATLALGGCGESRASGQAAASAASEAASASAASAGSAASAVAAGASSESSAVAQAASGEASAAGAAGSSNALVLYFSRAGENYVVGVVEQGNTEVLAEMIAEKTGADMFKIEPAKAYPESYDECCDVALAEQNAGERPAYVGDIDLGAYDTIYLGYPIWWGDLPMCVYTFLEAHDFAGKTIHPFCTHEGSGISGTDASIRSTCAGATVEEGLSMTGSTAQNSRDQAQSEVDAWLA